MVLCSVSAFDFVYLIGCSLIGDLRSQVRGTAVGRISEGHRTPVITGIASYICTKSYSDLVRLPLQTHLLWPPCVADADIILSSCGFFLLSFFLLLLLLSSPNLSGRRLDAYHTSTHDVALVRI